MSNRLRRQYGCPVELTIDVLGGKWKTVILARIKDGPLGYGALRRLVPGISDKMLSQKLRELMELGIVEQTDDADRVRYELTERGRELTDVLEALYLAGEVLAEPLQVKFPDAQT